MSPYTVSGITTFIKRLLEPHLLQVRVQGEVTNLRAQASGHIYFTLKDAVAQMPAVLFRSAATALARPLKNGDEIIASGSISIYPPRGGYQLVAQSVEFRGLGELLLRFQELKERLERKGYFDPSCKKTIPAFPKRIGVITSPSGAVIRDILNVLSRRAKTFHLILNPVRVQGRGAEIEIAQAIDQMNAFQLADVLILARGGGSLEDLWCFNEECVADAIHRSRIPLISAIGHETDFSIADFCSDLRAPTPSAAAEIVMQERIAQLTFLQNAKSQSTSSLRQKIQLERSRLARFQKDPLITRPHLLLLPYAQKLDEAEEELGRLAPMGRLAQVRVELAHREDTLVSTLRHFLAIKKEKLEHLATHFRTTNPKEVLRKGYCIPLSHNKKSVILSSKCLSLQEEMVVLFHDGEVITEVKKIENRDS